MTTHIVLSRQLPRGTEENTKHISHRLKSNLTPLKYESEMLIHRTAFDIIRVTFLAVIFVMD